jgi:hypothetical protein
MDSELKKEKIFLGLKKDAIRATGKRLAAPYAIALIVSLALWSFGLMTKEIFVASFSSISLVVGTLFTTYYREEKNLDDKTLHDRNFGEITVVRGLIESLSKYVIPSAAPKNDPSIKPIGVTEDRKI